MNFLIIGSETSWLWNGGMTSGSIKALQISLATFALKKSRTNSNTRWTQLWVSSEIGKSGGTKKIQGILPPIRFELQSATPQKRIRSLTESLIRKEGPASNSWCPWWESRTFLNLWAATSIDSSGATLLSTIFLRKWASTSKRLSLLSTNGKRCGSWLLPSTSSGFSGRPRIIN